MNEKTEIRLGNQTSFSSPGFDTPFDFAIDEGFSAFEFFPDKKSDGQGWSVSDISVKERRLIKKKAEDADISLSLHLPWQANPLGSDFSSLCRDNLEFAGDIGAVLVVVHLYIESGVSAYARAILPLAAMTAERGVRLAIENTPLTSPYDFNSLFRLLNEESDTAMNHLGMCLDIGHANLHESTRNDYLAYIDSLDRHVPVIHGHLHENYGDGDTHLTLFTGPSSADSNGISGVIRRLLERRFYGNLVFEQWPDPPELLSDAKKRLEKIVSDQLSEFVIPDRNAITLENHGDLTTELLSLDRKRRNWREKLDGVLEFLGGKSITDERLALSAIYLSFIGRGDLDLTEDGGHHRPSYHAKTAKAVEKRLSRIASNENWFILRRIYPWLPSHNEKFLSSEPLTRIRDIAHRNDIPRELKEEIKHTIQNKLHRSAGPEDLVTSERILKRITAPGASLSRSFVEEFIVFHKELKEFFNAESLTELLEKAAGDGSVPEAGKIRDFILLKEKQGRGPAYLLALLDALTGLRRLFLPFHWRKCDERAQKLRLADIALDKLAFVIASRLNNALSRASSVDFNVSLPALSLIIENIGIDKIYPEESAAVRNENDSLGKGFRVDERDDLLRLRANLERVIRITDFHAGRLLSLFGRSAQNLGRGLNIGDRAVRFFSEGSIRADLIFQLAKYARSLLKSVKGRLLLPEWETLFAGEAVGRLVDCGDSGLSVNRGEPAVVIAGNLTGDEEIPPVITGIILKKSIPLLSHLGIRAREQEVVFVICEDPGIEKAYSKHKGRIVKLLADTGRFEVMEFNGYPYAKSHETEAAVTLEEPELAERISLIEIDEVTAANAGGKAFGIKRLKTLSARPGSGFSVPETAVLPFGVFELSLKKSGLYEEFRSQTDAFNKYGANGEFPGALRELVGRVEFGVTEEVVKIFGADSRVMVRSSSNSEDIGNFAGAGLYESALDVKIEELEPALGKVCLSLWSGRAARRRKRWGLRSGSVNMAVVIQEMFTPELSFVMHSVNPVTGNGTELYIEAAPGHGDTLTSLSERGRPYSASVSKESLKIRLVSFSSFSNALLPSGSGLTRKCIDYSKERFHTDPGFRGALLGRIAGVGIMLEEFFGAPQDIEGFVSNGELYIVQSRRQPAAAIIG